MAFDDEPSTRWGGAPDNRDGWLAIKLAEPKTFSRIRINEAYDRIQKFEIQIQQDGHLRTIHAGTAVGGNFSATFNPVTGRHVRLNNLEATNVPTIWEVQLLAE